MKSRWSLHHIISVNETGWQWNPAGGSTKTVTTKYMVGHSETSLHPKRGVEKVKVRCSHCGKQVEVSIPSIPHMILVSLVLLGLFLIPAYTVVTGVSHSGDPSHWTAFLNKMPLGPVVAIIGLFLGAFAVGYVSLAFSGRGILTTDPGHKAHFDFRG